MILWYVLFVKGSFSMLHYADAFSVDYQLYLPCLTKKFIFSVFCVYYSELVLKLIDNLNNIVLLNITKT